MNREILITGANSYVGARMYLDLSRNMDLGILGTYRSEQNRLNPLFAKLDITDKKQTINFISRVNPLIIVHAAANASTKECNENPALAIEANVAGTENIVQAADKIGSKVIFISSTVAELANMHKSVYEETKNEAEMLLRESGIGYVILRPSVVFGMSPNTTTIKPFNEILRVIDGDKSLKFDSSWRYQPTWIGHLSEAVSAIYRNGITNETIPLLVDAESQDDLKSTFDIACDLLKPFNITPNGKDGKSHRADPNAVTSKRVDLALLRTLGIPTHSYDEIRGRIAYEMKNRERFAFRNKLKLKG